MSSDVLNSSSLEVDYTKNFQQVVKGIATYLFGTSECSHSTIQDIVSNTVAINTDHLLMIVRQNNKSEISAFLRFWGDGVDITEDILAAAIKATRGNEVLSLLLTHGGRNIKITEGLLKDAITEATRENETLSLLLAHEDDGTETPEQLTQLSAVHRMKALDERLRYPIRTTEILLEGAAKNMHTGDQIMAGLLNEARDNVVITEEMLVTAAKKFQMGDVVIFFILQYRGDKIKVTESVFKAAVENEETGVEVTRLLLAHSRDDFKITENMLEAAARNKRSGHEIMGLLLAQPRDNIVEITKGVLDVAASNWEIRPRYWTPFLRSVEIKSKTAKVVLALDRTHSSVQDKFWDILAAQREEVKVIRIIYKNTQVDGGLYDTVRQYFRSLEEERGLKRRVKAGYKEALRYRYLRGDKGDEVLVIQVLIRKTPGTTWKAISDVLFSNS